MEAPLILAERLLQVIRESGLNITQAQVGLSIAGQLLLAADDIPSPPLPAIPASLDRRD